MKHWRRRLFWLVVLLPAAVAAATLPDPTEPPNYSAIDRQVVVEVNKGWKLSAIKIGRDGNSAIINGLVVSEGAEIGSAKLIQISPTQVVLDYDGKHVPLKLLQRNVKTRTQSNLGTAGK